MPAFIGIQEIVLVVVLLLFIFGAKRLPEIGRSLGRGMREFKEGVTEERDIEPGADRRWLVRASSTTVTTPMSSATRAASTS